MKAQAQRQTVIHPFGPVFDSKSKVLILGSFPSVISRRQNFYYANPQNRFWPVLSAVFEEDCSGEVSQRTEFVLRHHIALWDVVASCTILGSSDASIQDVRVNDIQWLVDHSSIQYIYTTGSRAYGLYERYHPSVIEAVCLPSTSPANARMKLNDLISCYKVVRKNVEEG